MASATSTATGTSRKNDSAVSAATPTASVARPSVTQPGRAQPFGWVAQEAPRQRPVQGDGARGSDDQPGAADADRRRGGEQEHLGDQSGRRPLKRSQPPSALEHLKGSTVEGVIRFS